MRIRAFATRTFKEKCAGGAVCFGETYSGDRGVWIFISNSFFSNAHSKRSGKCIFTKALYHAYAFLGFYFGVSSSSAPFGNYPVRNLLSDCCATRVAFVDEYILCTDFRASCGILFHFFRLALR